MAKTRRMERTCSLIAVAAFLFAALAAGCSTRYIEGTRIEDSDESREVIRTVEIYRKAMEARDADMLIALASKNYFEKNGDSNSANNYDYDGLVRFLRSSQFRNVTSLKMKIVYKNILFNEDKTVATVRYNFNMDFKTPPPVYQPPSLPAGTAAAPAAPLTTTESTTDKTATSAAPQDNFDEERWHSKNDENEMILELENGRWYILKGM